MPSIQMPAVTEKTKAVRVRHCPSRLKVCHLLDHFPCWMSSYTASETGRLWEWRTLRYIQKVLSPWVWAAVNVTVSNNNSFRNTPFRAGVLSYRISHLSPKSLVKAKNPPSLFSVPGGLNIPEGKECEPEHLMVVSWVPSFITMTG